MQVIGLTPLSTAVKDKDKEKEGEKGEEEKLLFALILSDREKKGLV
jgi:hypothetical protein